MIFICDAMLGKLARYLRMLGLDAPYIRQGETVLSSPKEPAHTLVFTKSTAKAGRPGTILVHNNDPQEQVLEVKKYIEPYVDPDAFMTRCMECNVQLIEVRKEDIESFVPEYIYHHHDEFRTCPSCHKVYWEGSHADEMHLWLKEFLQKTLNSEA
ncbi:MAG: Mut7-C RNAse domain-containing protein [Syntrophorhabdaceae bacterium]|nr:Mut7-C RNAse domain-containing protein [Syntrophorhabdaceae bacterium]MDD4196952.1 Mut7-C RNAse domain-containing protein [Syntrophorhabdaceae bacterium]HOC46528.1 Mut7-C RNAse domain-containing protein [Syntrophorhabdaceae bacterium]